MAHERRDGPIELLLTTPMLPRDIVAALVEAGAHQLRRPRQAALASFLAMMILGFFVRTWNGAALASYLIAWAILCWLIMARPRKTLISIIWVALISGRAGFALYRTHAWGYGMLIGMSYNLYKMAAGFGNAAAQFPKGTAIEIVFVAFAALAVLVCAHLAREPSELLNSLHAQMRAIAEKPVPDADDPRFRKWTDIKQPFPAAD